MRGFLKTAICLCLVSTTLAFAAFAESMALLEVANLALVPSTLPDGRVLEPGESAVVEVAPNVPGTFMGRAYPALPAGGRAFLALGTDNGVKMVRKTDQTPRHVPAKGHAEPIAPGSSRVSAGARPPEGARVTAPPAGQRQEAMQAPQMASRMPARGTGAGTTAHILSKIDTDGVYLKVINAEQFESEALARIRALCLIGYRLASKDDHQAARAFAARVGKVVQGTGIFAIQGCGESISGGDGQWWRTKAFLMRTPLAGTDLSIKAPTRYLPDTSYIACASTFNLSGFSSLVEGTLEKCEPELYSDIRQAEAELSAQAQVGDLGALEASFAPGFVFAIASENAMALPSGYGSSVEIPGIMVGFRLRRDDSVIALRSLLSRSCVDAGVQVKFETRGSGDLANVTFFDFSQQEAIEALKFPLPLSIAHDRDGKMLLISTSRALLRHSILASRGKAGSLEDSALFKAHAAGLPQDGGLTWFSPDFVPKLIKEVLSSGLIGVESEEKAREAVDVISLFIPKFWGVSRSIQQEDGVMTIANRPSIESTSVMLIDHFFGVSLMSLAETVWKILPEDSFADFVMMVFGAWKDEGLSLPFDIDDLQNFGDPIFN